MRRLLPLILSVGLVETVVVAFLLLAPEGRSDPSSEGDLRIAVSVAPQGYLVSRIGGAHVSVTVMIPPGASPHTYEPTPSQVRELSEADLYVMVGHPVFPFERSWLQRVLGDYPDLRIFNSSEGISLIEDDPHVWVSPTAVRVQAQHLAEALRTLRPDLSAEIDRNLAVFLADIEELQGELHRALDPLSQRHFLVFHPSWGYFARDFGLVQVSIEHHHEEPSPAELGELIEHAREHHISVIFVQPGFDRRHAQVIAEEIGARVEVVDPLAPDWLDNLRRVGAVFAAALE